MLEPQPNLRIKLNVGMLAGAIAIVLLVIAILSRKTDPHFSSFAFVSALLTLFGITANFAVPKIQSFLYRREYRSTMPYQHGSTFSSGNDNGASMDGGISCNFGDGGGCDGGG